MAPSPPQPPSLQSSIQTSTSTWQTNLHSLFKLAKERFPDVVWELMADEDDIDAAHVPEEVWGHKAIVYARAPPSFQARYFSFRPAPIGTPSELLTSPNGTLNGQSALSLSDFHDLTPYRAGSPSPSTAPSTTPGTILRLPTSINPALFANELEYLYTGKGFGAAFEFLFDTSESREEGDAEENRVDKLRKDLVFMWRSRLYSDVRIALTGSFSSSSSTNHENATAIFSSHRFILVSRSPYFHNQLLSWPSTKPPQDAPLTLNLPSPPFTPASLHFTLGYIYTGTLVFSHRGYDLDTAFHIMRAATYLAIDPLYDEIQARIVQEMMHGLFHAFLDFSEYEHVTGGKWGTGGCRCRQCARRAPRTLEFALADDVRNPHLERGARRALVGLFGEGWCTSEFAGLPSKTRESLLKGLAKRTTPLNIFPLLFAAQHAMDKLNAVIDAWADTSREMVLAARRVIDDVLCARAEECFELPEWVEILEGDGTRFDDGEKVKWVLESLKRGLTDRSAAMVYQVVVSSILLRPHTTETGATMLSSTSSVRVQVEEARVEILRWLRRRYVGVRHEGGFNALEGWAVKEISGEIDVPVEELLNPTPPSATPANTPAHPTTSTTPTRNTAYRANATLSQVDVDADSGSIRASVLTRNTTKHSVTPSQREQNLTMGSSASSVRSMARSTTVPNPATPTPESKRPDLPSGPRPDSKFAPSSASIHTTQRSSVLDPKTPPPPLTKTLLTKVTPRTPSTASLRSSSMFSTTTSPALRPKSSAPSIVSSVRSKTPTARKSSIIGGGGSSTNLRPPTVASRPTSSLSTTSDASTTYKSVQSDLHLSAGSRRTSTASTISAGSTKTQTGKLTISRPRVPSAASSVVSTTTTPPAKTKRPSSGPSAGVPESGKLSPGVAKRSPSMASVKSTTSTVSSVAPSPPPKKTPLPLRKTVGEKKSNNGQLPPLPASPASTIKCKNRAEVIVEEDIPLGKVSSESGSTIRTVKNRGSTDTIKMAVDKPEPPAPVQQQQEATPQPPVFADGIHNISPRGATLEIGIPCIISSKRKRFRAYARYIGEVEGEYGPWVGVEVPVGESWVGDKLEGRQWNDGTWGGVRYFDIGAAASEWDDGDNDRAVRRRKLDIMNGSVKGLKREGDQLSVDRAKRLRSASPATSDVSNSESRGLFVRPQQVLYVVDAVGTDL